MASQNNLRRNGFVRVHHLEQTQACKQPSEEGYSRRNMLTWNLERTEPTAVIKNISAASLDQKRNF
jgi:hypothetical protein